MVSESRNLSISGDDVFSLQQILGYSTLEMVRRYVSLASAQVVVQHTGSSRQWARWSSDELELAALIGAPEPAVCSGARLRPSDFTIHDALDYPCKSGRASQLDPGPLPSGLRRHGNGHVRREVAIELDEFVDSRS